MNEDTPFYTAVCIASAFPNAVSLPIMILETACKRSDVNEEYNSDPDECYTASMSMLFVYSIGWNFVFWGFGRFELEKCSKLMTDQTNRNKITSSSCASSKVSIVNINNNDDDVCNSKVMDIDMDDTDTDTNEISALHMNHKNTLADSTCINSTSDDDDDNEIDADINTVMKNDNIHVIKYIWNMKDI